MKHKKHLPISLHDIRGFTLIELMIVVGIIGILVAIAAPNFARYQSKARQTEAKIALSAIYVGEKSFHSEYSSYISSLDSVGYLPEGNKRYYTVGFNTTDTTTVAGYNGTITTANYARVNYPSAWSECAPDLSVGASGTTDPQTFTAAASGQLRDGAACDVWTIDDAKVVSNTTVNL